MYFSKPNFTQYRNSILSSHKESNQRGKKHTTGVLFVGQIWLSSTFDKIRQIINFKFLENQSIDKLVTIQASKDKDVLFANYINIKPCHSYRSSQYCFSFDPSLIDFGFRKDNSIIFIHHGCQLVSSLLLILFLSKKYLIQIPYTCTYNVLYQQSVLLCKVHRECVHMSLVVIVFVAVF